MMAAEAQGDIAQGRTPKRAVAVSVVLALVSVALNWFLPSSLLGILINSVGMVLLIIWILIVIAQMRLRPSLEAAGTLTIRMPLWPYLSWVVLAALGVVVVLMMTTDSGRAQLAAMGGLSVLVVAIFFVRERWLARR